MKKLLHRTAVGLLGFCLGLLLPLVVQAQILEEDKETYVKKGFFFSVAYGPVIIALPSSVLNVLPNPSLNIPGGPRISRVGHLGGVSLGFDLADRFGLSLGFLTTQSTGDPQLGGGAGTYVFNLEATIHFVRLEQLYLYFKLGAGAMLTLPSNAGVPFGIMGHAGLGLLYYTRMRHLAIGFDILGLVGIPFPPSGAKFTDLLSVSIGVMPKLVYTF